MENRINKRKTMTGVVISDKMLKTRVVEVKSQSRHPKYGKLLNHYSRYKAHDEKNESHTGDMVKMMQCRPLSKDKRWIIMEILEKNTGKEAVAV